MFGAPGIRLRRISFLWRTPWTTASAISATTAFTGVHPYKRESRGGDSLIATPSSPIVVA